ncbi:response regulator [Rhizobium sp. NPDC090279]|uniref:response regulator n=1 Tax=Rhizobium sp. NPDC090279 TaxID=3364499 RepID=UPI00383B3C0E
MTLDGELLGIACRRIAGLDRPAYIKNSELRYVAVNDAYARFFGHAISDFIGNRSHDLLDAGESADIEDRERRALVFGSEEIALCFDASGEHRSRIQIESFSAAEDRVYIFGMFLGAPAKTLHHDLDNILRSMPIGVLIHDSDYIVEYVNDAFYDIWEFSKDDRFEGRPYRDLIAKHYELARFGSDGRSIDDIYQARLAALRKAGEHLQTEVNFADGKSVIIDARQISNGKTLMSYMDITSVKQQSQEITETRLALERLGELMADAMLAMSQGLLIVQDGTIMLANDRLKDMLKLPAELLEVGKDWSAAFDYCAERGDFGDDPDAVRTSWAQSIAASKPISCVFQVTDNRWMQLDAAIGGHRRWTAVLTDVTEMKEREADLQLLLARSNAADRAKSEFLTHMSHEIRTPMNGVLGMAELLGKTDLDARQKTFVDIIVKSGNALLTIINDILDFSRIDTGEMHLRKMAFDPAEAVEDITTLLAAAASEKNIELMVHIAPGVPAGVLGDAGRFRQIVTNLVGNAIKFTERGHVLVELNGRSAPDDKILLGLRVEDTGIGIPDEKLDTIFDKFSLADSSFARRLEGSGLGLAITAGLVDLFGGSLSVKSEWGKGSVFTAHVPMPLVAAHGKVAELPVNVRQAGVLIVEDDAIHRGILTEQLVQWGFDGHVAEDGKTALAILDAAADMGVSVDAIIIDYSMPDMNGYQVASAVRADPRFDALPIVFLTSMGVAGCDKEFAAVNGQAHLMKPVRANVLRSTIIDVVRASRRKKLGERSAPAERRLPIEVEAAAAIEATDQLASVEPGNAIDVLVAEDNDVNQIVFTQILQATGLRFLVVENGKAAVDAWRQLRPSLIFMDVSMPVMNGHQASRMIRQLETQLGRGGHVPIVGVTAQGLDVDRIMCMQSGMDDCLSKPISPELLEAKIERYLGKAAFQADRSNS